MPVPDEALDLAVMACRAADDKKADGLTILEVGDVLGVADLFALATANSDRNLKAIVDEIEHKAKEDFDRRPLRREGTPESGWVLIDFGDVVCHLFSREQREFYALERLWSDVPRRDPLTGEPDGTGLSA